MTTNKGPRFYGLEIQLVVLAGLAVVLMTLVGVGVSYKIESSQKKKAFEARVERLIESHSSSLARALWNYDADTAEGEVRGMLEFPDVDAVQLMSDQEIQHFGVKLDQQSLVIEKDMYFDADAKLDRKKVGRIRIYSDYGEVHKDLSAAMMRGFFQSFLILNAIGWMLMIYMRYHMIRPLTGLARQMENLDFESKPVFLKDSGIVRKYMRDEIYQLEEYFQHMAERIFHSKVQLEEINQGLEDKVDERTREILEQRRQLESSARLKSLGEMAGSIAHEINNPLAVIMARAELISRGSQDNPLLKKNAETIMKTAERITSIVKALRVLSRDGSNDPFEWTPLDVVLSDVMGLSTEKLRNRSVELRISNELSALELECRRVQVAQVLVNLMNNSIDAIAESQERWIGIESKVIGAEFVIEFSDSGPGVPKEVQEKILTPFFTTKEIGKGTGLGLSLSQTIMQSHQGRFGFDFSREHTTVVLAFPIERVRKVSGPNQSAA